MQLDMERLLLLAEARIRERDKAERAADVGTGLRGGNSGCVTDAGEILGKCPRLTLLRYLGIEEDKADTSTTIMFAGGRLNEVYWENLLKEVTDILADEYQVGQTLVEPKGLVSWSVTDGDGKEYPVTGTPDLVFSALDNTPLAGGELKKVSSRFRANRVAVKGQIDSGHFIQAAHYSWALGKIPWVISYTSFDSHDTYGKPVKIPPQRWHFYLSWDGDTACYTYQGETFRTSVTGEGIRNYYTLVAEMLRTKQLGPRPGNTHVSGEGEDFPHCSNCWLKDFCDNYEHDYETWLSRVKAEV